jgi:RNA polymerase sigma factor (sigma-70 family)
MNEDSRQRFDMAVQALLDPDSPDTHSLYAFIQITLSQFRLSKAYEVKDIIIEVYTRGIKKLQSGDIIQIPLAWIRRTAHNVIRELRREADKTGYLDLDCVPVQDIAPLSKIEFNGDLKAIKIAFNRLTLEEQNILKLRVIDQLSWQEVGKCLVIVGEPIQSEGNLRQRGYRTLKKLRKIYDAFLLDFSNKLLR